MREEDGGARELRLLLSAGEYLHAISSEGRRHQAERCEAEGDVSDADDGGLCGAARLVGGPVALAAARPDRGCRRGVVHLVIVGRQPVRAGGCRGSKAG